MLRRSARALLPLAAQVGGGANPSPTAAARLAAGGFAAQDVRQPATHQQRWQSALPQPAYAFDDEHADIREGQELEAQRRRLQEMAGSTAATRLADPTWPTPEQVAERLRSSRGASCSSSSSSSSSSGGSSVGGTLRPAHGGQPTPEEADGEGSSNVLDWRRVVDAVRLNEQDISGKRMLTDTFGRMHTYLRISLTERCNLRCLYCMPEEGVDLSPGAYLLSTAEVLRVARLFAAGGVNKVRLTGGEPTLRKDLVELTGQLSQLQGVQAVGITSNGLTLGRKLAALKEAGMSLLNISLDTLQPDRFVAMTRRQGHDRVLATIHQAVELGYDPVKVNAVVMRGVNEDEVPAFVELTRNSPINIRFIEYMPFDGNVWSEPKMAPYKDLLAAVQRDFGQLERCADPRGEVAKNFRVPGFRGTVSFITSMTKTFCSDCNRLRVMADGNLKVCLFGANEVSLRDAMREGATDEDLRAIVSAAVDRKRAAHAGMFELASAKNRAMVKIGG
ncbi:hypothetical protein D9Q98_002240 [Chlorella vulgaris]|uniref:GTP 3',8-cyclase n=1 Tax=Chlorella vulgaris TaxID=3077 RepID=A0A9D4Z0H6_CHLVU|nr:hypothetical protein D9Q98_002240 [Chlorella vulgaris]